MGRKTAKDLLKGDWGGEREKIVPFFSRIPIRSRVRTKRVHCRIVEKKKKNLL